MKVKSTLEKKFRWFYTYYIYRENYPKIQYNFDIPIEKYMSKEEAQFWFTGKPNLLLGMNGIEIREYSGNLEDKYNLWFAQNNWNKGFEILVENYDLIKNQPVTKERLISLRDTIFEKSSKDLQDINMEKILNKYFKTTAFTSLWETKNSPMVKFEKDFDNQDYVQYFNKAFTFKLVMPGKVSQPSNVEIQGDTLVWKLTAYRMIHDNFTIEAESRKANVWAFILTAVIMIVAVGSFFWKPGRKRSKWEIPKTYQIVNAK